MEVTTAAASKRTRAKAAPAASPKPAAKASPRKSSAKATAPAPMASPAEPVDLADMIATTAYFLAAERHFTPGRELDDWLEAERRVQALVHA